MAEDKVRRVGAIFGVIANIAASADLKQVAFVLPPKEDMDTNPPLMRALRQDAAVRLVPTKLNVYVAPQLPETKYAFFEYTAVQDIGFDGPVPDRATLVAALEEFLTAAVLPAQAEDSDAVPLAGASAFFVPPTLVASLDRSAFVQTARDKMKLLSWAAALMGESTAAALEIDATPSLLEEHGAVLSPSRLDAQTLAFLRAEHPQFPVQAGDDETNAAWGPMVRGFFELSFKGIDEVRIV